MGYQDGALRATNVTIADLLGLAYGVQTPSISGLPKWAQTERFDVIATVGDPVMGAPSDRVGLQLLLKQRFALVAHLAAVPSPVLDLVVAPGGPHLQRNTKRVLPVERIDLAPISAHGALTANEVEQNGEAKQARDKQEAGDSPKTREIVADDLPLSDLADRLTLETDQMVLDRTGLSGSYDLRLIWTPTATEEDQPAPDPHAADQSLLAALRTQLGLELQPKTEDVDTLVVERLQQPAGR